ncbi:MAG: DUF5946 family protein [Chloroflexota bacterium]|nr:DUF5946 family protein [Chloroflexota bacterium]
MSEVCAGCGVAVDGGTEGCQRLFESIGLHEYEDMRFARHHRIVVDVYAMQHPDRYGRSAKSFAAHLTGLCAWLEDEDDPIRYGGALRRWARSTWSAYAPLHAIARVWIATAPLHAVALLYQMGHDRVLFTHPPLASSLGPEVRQGGEMLFCKLAAPRVLASAALIACMLVA